MSGNKNKKALSIEFIGVGLYILIFLFDLYTPKGIADGVLYTAVLFMFMGSSGIRFLMGAAITGIVLIVVGYLISPAPPIGIEESAIINRGLSVLIIFICALVILKYKKKEKEHESMLLMVSDYKYALDEAAIVAITDQRGVIKKVNKNLVKISKYSEAELLGEDHRIVNSGFHSKQFMKNLWVTIANGKIWKGEIKNKAKDGSVYWVDTTIIPFLNEQNKPYQYLAIRFNISSRKELEEQHLKQKEELSKYVYISSHDLQEPLRKIETFTYMVMQSEHQNLSSEGKDYLKRMHEAAKRMRQQLEDLLMYSSYNSSEQEIADTNLNTIVEAVKNDLSDLINQKEASITVDATTHVSVVPNMFHRLFWCLIHNSLKFSRPGLTPQINISCRIENSDEIDNPKLLSKTQYYRISVKDNGIGFDPQHKDRIFEVFQRLHNKEDYEGTGIGLALVKRIVEHHKGIITATSGHMKGTRFDIFIPTGSDFTLKMVGDSVSMNAGIL